MLEQNPKRKAYCVSVGISTLKLLKNFPIETVSVERFFLAMKIVTIRLQLIGDDNEWLFSYIKNRQGQLTMTTVV